jgi:hypothetical protein
MSTYTSAGSPGFRSSGQYLIAGQPFLVKAKLDDGKVYKVVLPYLSRSITVINQDAASDDVYLAFANHANAWDHHSITLANNRDSITMNIRCTEFYLKASGDVDIEVFAELTQVNPDRHGSWASADQSQKGIDKDLALTGNYPSDAAANDIIDQT